MIRKFVKLLLSVCRWTREAVGRLLMFFKVNGYHCIMSPKRLDRGVGMDDVTKYPLITEELLKRGYSKKSIKKILGGNVLRVMKANFR